MPIPRAKAYLGGKPIRSLEEQIPEFLGKHPESAFRAEEILSGTGMIVSNDNVLIVRAVLEILMEKKKVWGRIVKEPDGESIEYFAEVGE